MADAWEERRYSANYLVDCCGRHLRVVFPGRRWGGPGPDFKGAVLADARGALVRGDVEVHVRSSSWNAHGHASDPAYAGVVLHVVRWVDAVAVDGRGEHVAAVELLPLRGRPLRRVPPPHGPCLRSATALLNVVEAAGRARFRARAARFEGDMALVDADQVLWRGIAEALGFRRNREPFGQLAEALPWSLAAQVVTDRGPVGLAGALLGTAGLLADATLPEAHAWRGLQRRLGLRQALSGASWERAQVRPGAAPVMRCRGLAELAARWIAGQWQMGGPAEQVLAAVRQAAGERRPRLRRLVQVSPWIGDGRAQVIVINVLLPFAAAAGLQQAEAVFERVPGEPGNRVLRYMASQLGATRFRGACQQQGLLQLFTQTCAARACERCPARRPGARLLATIEGAEASYD